MSWPVGQNTDNMDGSRWCLLPACVRGRGTYKGPGWGSSHNPLCVHSALSHLPVTTPYDNSPQPLTGYAAVLRNHSVFFGGTTVPMCKITKMPFCLP